MKPAESDSRTLPLPLGLTGRQHCFQHVSHNTVQANLTVVLEI